MNYSKIIKDVMSAKGYSSITDFANDIGISYMKLYYVYNGKTNNMSEDLAYRIVGRFPDINVAYLFTGHGSMLNNSVPKDYTPKEPVLEEPKPKEQEPTEQVKEEAKEQKPRSEISNSELFGLLERITALFERIQDSEESMRKDYNRIVTVEERVLSLLERLERLNRM